MRHIAFILLFVLSACATPAEIEANRQHLARLNKVAEPIVLVAAERCRCRYEFSLMDSKAPDARGIGGLRIGFTVPMMEFLSDDDDLAFVIGHEVAHKLFGHRISADIEQDAINEIDADRLGIQLAKKAGYNVKKVPGYAQREDKLFAPYHAANPLYRDPAQRSRRYDALVKSVEDALSSS